MRPTLGLLAWLRRCPGGAVASLRPPASMVAPSAILAVALTLAVTASAVGQTDLPTCPDPGTLDASVLLGPAGDFTRAAETRGHAPFRSLALRRPADRARTTICDYTRVPWHRWIARRTGPSRIQVEARPLRLIGEVNTTYPQDRNNGGLWAGRGVTSGVTGGLSVAYGPVSFSAQPLLTYQQNREYRTAGALVPGHLEELYHGHPARIDWPSRFGARSFWEIQPGQSYARLDLAGLAAGVSTENLWWGPAQRYAIVLSNTAPGFPHAFVRTTEPIDLWGVARVEGEMIWGRLTESDYFDADASNNHRAAGGFVIAVNPGFTPGLWLGAARMRVTSIPAVGRDMGDYLLEPVRTGETVDGHAALEITTLFGRYALPESGFEVYAEVALPVSPAETNEGGAVAGERAPGYSVGMARTLEVRDNWVRIYAEALQLQSRLSLRDGSPTATYYVHPRVAQGYSHRGQLLGASVGPGAEAQTLGVDIYHGWGRAGLFVERIGYDDDAYFANYVHQHGLWGHDIEVAGGIRQTLVLGEFEASLTLRLANRRNRDFVPLDEGYWAEPNGTAAFSVSWVPGGGSLRADR